MNRSLALQAGLALLIGLILVGFVEAGALIPAIAAGAALAAAAAALRGVAQPAPVPVPVRARRGRRGG
ncbi:MULTISPECIES: hypothetical protein [unclassified Methylobacterium]|uniref:hypothetical protein n=1 Tax=unclassified Methylobacterium TaxID=2615210 RepID=UPI0003022084|nr:MULTISPECIES: hypothetical protein [Methylobacterium]WFT82851.1 hypothetical protein QA634_13825 [Methylobacterium nodulans]